MTFVKLFEGVFRFPSANVTTDRADSLKNSAHADFSAHQGQVHIENRPQGGARVVLTLPLHPKETPAWWDKQKKRFPV
jgi:hypothetical protein